MTLWIMNRVDTPLQGKQVLEVFGFPHAIKEYDRLLMLQDAS